MLSIRVGRWLELSGTPGRNVTVRDRRLGALTVERADVAELAAALAAFVVVDAHDGGCLCRACKRAVRAAAKEAGF